MCFCWSVRGRRGAYRRGRWCAQRGKDVASWYLDVGPDRRLEGRHAVNARRRRAGFCWVLQQSGFSSRCPGLRLCKGTRSNSTTRAKYSYEFNSIPPCVQAGCSATKKPFMLALLPSSRARPLALRYEVQASTRGLGEHAAQFKQASASTLRIIRLLARVWPLLASTMTPRSRK